MGGGKGGEGVGVGEGGIVGMEVRVSIGVGVGTLVGAALVAVEVGRESVGGEGDDVGVGVEGIVARRELA